jgi:hypothetical protein
VRTASRPPAALQKTPAGGRFDQEVVELVQITGFCTRWPQITGFCRRRYARADASLRRIARDWLASGTSRRLKSHAQVCGVAQELGSASAEYLTQSERSTAVYTVASWSGETGAQVNAVVGIYLFMYSGRHRCRCLFVLVRACMSLVVVWCMNTCESTRVSCACVVVNY